VWIPSRERGCTFLADYLEKKGCTCLADHLEERQAWQHLFGEMSFKQLKERVDRGGDFVFDLTFDFQLNKAKQTNFFKSIDRLLEAGFDGRMIIMCHGDKSELQHKGYILLSISDAPKAPC
jgi:hypothetical protein